eukprot:318447-Chlamydomonas_euryale.AAC.1
MKFRNGEAGVLRKQVWGLGGVEWEGGGMKVWATPRGIAGECCASMCGGWVRWIGMGGGAEGQQVWATPRGRAWRMLCEQGAGAWFD